eukprot:CAMPEP_0178419576 /NCGR_PEP_ID=MMETSP0689_2-20121128/25683_1 /TAXON_ID=160604 /ORGANISM="Amphidinium massartii, Strain CS-259" /LENGTH=1241 /DNA_ID=CAMNT_0020041021 /DNA_START=17 /DNA_END=3742 /DNA_ORIENTATION=-
MEAPSAGDPDARGEVQTPATPAAKRPKLSATGAAQQASDAKPPLPPKEQQENPPVSLKKAASPKQAEAKEFVAPRTGVWVQLKQSDLYSVSRGVKVPVAGLRWQQDMLLSDPPSLSLKGQGGSSYFSGELRRFSSKLIKPLAKSSAQRLYLEPKALGGLFQKMLQGVRYPPLPTMEFSWRVSQLQVKDCLNPTPKDMRGPLPARPFKLLNNSDDAMAAQPPHFTGPQLRPEQLRSLGWMLAQEGHKDQGMNAGAAADDEDLFEIEWRGFWTNPRPEDWTSKPSEIYNHARVEFINPSKAKATPMGRSFDDGRSKAEAAPTTVGTVLWRRGPEVLNVDFDGRKLACAVNDLRYAPMSEIKSGAHVVLSADTPLPGHGVSRDSVGLVRDILVDGKRVADEDSSSSSSDGARQARVWFGRCSKSTHVSMTEPPSSFILMDEPKADVVEVQCRAQYKVRGGLLCDSIGYGKTATTIGLISSTLTTPPPPVPELDKDAFIPAKGTLIIVPANLYEQWLEELAKFTWHGNSLRKKLTNGWAPEDCPLKIFAAHWVVPLRGVSAKELAEADVVLCSYRLLYSTIYRRRRKELSDAAMLLDGVDGSELSVLSQLIRRLTRGEVPVNHAARDAKGIGKARHPHDLEFPVLEMFHWKRIVFDEFHELESFESNQQHTLQHLRSHFRWGLTGTPPIDSNAGVICMSSLFRVDLAGYLIDSEVDKKGTPNLAKWESDRLLTEAAARFLDRYARQNTAVLPDIGLQNHVVFVRHSPAERALYLGQAHDAPDFARLGAEVFKSETTRLAVERLVKLCSHFQAAGDDTLNAKQECARIGELKVKAAMAAEAQVEVGICVLLVLESRLPAAFRWGLTDWRSMMMQELEPRSPIPFSNDIFANFFGAPTSSSSSSSGSQGTGGRNRAKEIVAAALLKVQRESHEWRMARLRLALRQEEHAQAAEVLFTNTTSPDFLKMMLQGQATSLVRSVVALRDAISSRDFFQQTLKAVGDEATPEARSCSICLEENLPLCRLAITPCAHTFCTDCLTASARAHGSCGICRRPIQTCEIRAIESEMRPMSGKTAVSQPTAGYDKYGTKLAAVMKKLHEIRAADPTGKVILFVQFEDLKNKVAAALREFQLPVLTLHGPVATRSKIIHDWQHNASSKSFVLLLSLVQSASGTNLTAANHVVFLHPMLASTPAQASNFEKQAIGRARRHGQLRDTVHVWRFVTRDTVEQQMSEQHQALLGADVLVESE